jgi:nicotinamidase-related amidase
MQQIPSVRDPLADHLITPQNAALLLIDYRPSQLALVRSMDRALLVKNAVSTVKTIKTFGVPVVHSTVNVASGRQYRPAHGAAASLTRKAITAASASGATACAIASSGKVARLAACRAVAARPRSPGSRAVHVGSADERPGAWMRVQQTSPPALPRCGESPRSGDDQSPAWRQA